MGKKRLTRWILVALGCVSLGLGVVGVFVPLLPTTPFLLLSAALFVRSSPELYHWLINHRWFGPYIRHYREHRAITLQAKAFTLILLWGTIIFAAVRVVDAWWLRGLLGVIAIGVTVHVLSLKTLTPEMLGQDRAAEAD